MEKVFFTTPTVVGICLQAAVYKTWEEELVVILHSLDVRGFRYFEDNSPILRILVACENAWLVFSNATEFRNSNIFGSVKLVSIEFILIHII